MEMMERSMQFLAKEVSKKTAEEFKKDFMGEIPIDHEVGKQGDLGSPIVESKPEHEISKIYFKLAEKIKSIYL